MEPRILAEVNSVEDLELYRRRHRLAVHQTLDDDAFFDCALCGVIDSRLARFQRLRDRPAPETVQ
jgi:hypothetical protein